MEWLGKIGASIAILVSSVFGGLFHHTPSTISVIDIVPTASEESNIASSTTKSRLGGQAAINKKFTFNNCPPPYKDNSLVILDTDLVTDVNLDRTCAPAVSNVFIYNNEVYLVPEPNDPTWGARAALVAGADPKTFAYLGYNYWEDESHIYYQQFWLPGADPISWLQMTDVSLMEHHFSRDKNSVYFYDQVLPGVDPKTFVLVSDHSAKDKNNAYEFKTADHIILTLDPRIKSISHPLAIGFVTFDVVNTNPNTLQVLEHGFTKDSQKVYFGKHELVGADPASFQILSNFYAKDRSSVYYFDTDYDQWYEDIKKISEADLGTFRILNPNVKESYYDAPYATDKKNVYLEGKKIEGADPATFQINLPNDQYYHLFSKDKNHVYYKYGDDITRSLDSATFVIFDDGNEKDCGWPAVFGDKNGVYSILNNGLSKISGADINTYKFIPPTCNWEP